MSGLQVDRRHRTWNARCGRLFRLTSAPLTSMMINSVNEKNNVN